MKAAEAIEAVKNGPEGTIAVSAGDLGNPDDMVPRAITKANLTRRSWMTTESETSDWVLYRPAKVWTVEEVTAGGAAFSYDDAMAIRAALGDLVKCRCAGGAIVPSPVDPDNTHTDVPRYTFTRSTVTEFSRVAIFQTGLQNSFVSFSVPDNAEPGEWEVTCRRKP